MLREYKAPYPSDCHALHHWLDEKLALDVLRNILDFLLKHLFHSFKQLYIWGFACCKIFIFSHFKECLSGRYNTVSSPGHAASSWVLCVSGRRKQYSWLMTSRRRRKNLKNLTCLVATLHYNADYWDYCWCKELKQYVILVFIARSVITGWLHVSEK